MKKRFVFASLFLIFLSFAVLNFSYNNKTVKLISPVVNRANVLGINQWFPAILKGEQAAIRISAKAALFAETKNGEVLYGKNIEGKLPIASLVKVMTVLIALEYKSMDDIFTVTPEAANMEPDKMQLVTGEKLSLKELLSGIFLVSANDAAELIAEQSTGSRAEFIRLMNDKAKQLGMKNTYFANPTGLDEDNNNSYSTVYDLTVLTRYLIRRYPDVVKISSEEHVFLPQTEDHQDYDMYSGINLLTTYPGVVGFKTGFTPEAGMTLITLARRDGREVIGVLLGSESRRDEARELLDYSFSQLK